MKTETLYRCEICNTQYTSKQTCKECEQSHLTNLQIVNTQYSALNSKTSTYPHKICVKFEDGKERWYKE